MPVHPEPVDVPLKAWQGFDRLSPNGVWFVCGAFVFPIILSLSKGKLSPNGVGGAKKQEASTGRVQAAFKKSRLPSSTPLWRSKA
jgi:hypothetical protein